MIVSTQKDLEQLRHIGGIVARTLREMAAALEPGISTAELDAIGEAALAREGAVSAPMSSYNFPGATCISVNEEAAHGIPGSRLLRKGDLVNIDVSASKNGYFADTGASFAVGPVRRDLAQLLADGKRALDIGLQEVRAGAQIAAIGTAIGKFAEKRGYTLIRNLASHGIGRKLHEYPGEIATWPNKRDRRLLTKGLVLTVEPFLSMGGTYASQAADGWTLISEPSAPCVQFEHTVVTSDRGPIILTLP